MPHHRYTLVVRKSSKPSVDWNQARSLAVDVAFVDSMKALRFALRASTGDSAIDIERVIIDRAGTAEEFLELLATITYEFPGDVLFIRDNGTGFLSATGRGGDRVLYALKESDMWFYLETHGLVVSRSALDIPLELSA